MDFPNVLLQIEKACADMQVQATRIAGEKIIMSFKQMPGNLEACKYVLVIIKRSLEDYHDGEKHAVITDLQSFVSMGGYSQLIGIGLSNSLVDEFSSTKASNVGLPWDFHKKSKDFFENTYLLPIFELTLRVNDAILGLSLSLAEKSLCWDFSYKNDTLLAGTFAKEGSDIIEEELFITTKTRLHGDIFESEEQIIEYVIIMKQEILELINNLSNNVAERPTSTLEYGPDLLSIAQMTRRLLCTISLPILCKVPEISTFLHEVAQLSATCLRESVVVKDNYGYFIEDSFSTWSLEAFDELLIIWVKLVQCSSHNEIPHHQITSNQGLIAFLGEASYHIAATYIDTRLEIAKYSTNDEEEESNNFKDW
ncbi:902_t:CDS:2, partial [Diversispora eburnea]